MKKPALFLAFATSFCSFGQQYPDRLVAEISPVNMSLEGFCYNIQGKMSYSFNKYLSVSLRHNQQVSSFELTLQSMASSRIYRKNSLSDFCTSVTLWNSEKPVSDPSQKISSSGHLLQADLGLSYYKFGTGGSDYYAYDKDDQGNNKIISSINRLSASLGVSYLLRSYQTADPERIKLKRQHTFSAGVYYGLNYDLQGYVAIKGKNPSEKPPKNYTFNRFGYYIRYNFRQQITKHLFAGADVLFAQMPSVQYKTTPKVSVFRGGEAEKRIQPYAGITVGWTF